MNIEQLRKLLVFARKHRTLSVMIIVLIVYPSQHHLALFIITSYDIGGDAYVGLQYAFKLLGAIIVGLLCIPLIKKPKKPDYDGTQ